MRAPVTLEAVQPDQEAVVMEAEIVQLGDIETTPLPSETPSVSAATPAKPKPIRKPVSTKPVSVPTTTLDAMMRDVIADALCVLDKLYRRLSVNL